ncbi:MAG: hypothetical protein AAGJ79_01265, partial [Verrucomicrobiota bacterium]
GEGLMKLDGTFSQALIDSHSTEVTAPGLGPLSVDRLNNYEVTTNCRLVIDVELEDSVGNSYSGLCFVTSSDRQVVVVDGHTSVPVNGGTDTIDFRSQQRPPAIASDGSVVFAARTIGGRDGVFRWRAGSLETLLIEGSEAPGFPGRNLSTSGAPEFSCNPRGDLIIKAVANLPSATDLLYQIPVGSVEARLLLREGDWFMIDGERQNLTSFRAIDSSFDRDTHNGQGQFVFLGTFRNENNVSSSALLLIESQEPLPIFTLVGSNAVIQVTTIPGKRLGVRRTSDFDSFATVASGIVGNGEIVEVVDEQATSNFDQAYYVVVDEGEL